ncbi:MAG TPA: SDR family oxidoreductase [Acidimicrobiia bacterium]|nr:SDR family oxidoreductase [Acidimicrobiia bacterium]
MTSPEDILADLRADLLPHHVERRRVTDLMDLTGTRAVVTGGGGPGLGQAVAHRLAGLGATLVVVDLDAAAAEGVAGEVATRWGTRAIPVVADVTDWDDVHRTVSQAAERLGGIDVWVNNVGGGGRPGAYASTTKEAIDDTVATTLLGTMYCTRAVLDVMVPQRSGRIINISSEGGKIGMRNLAVYNACKSAIIGFTRNLAHELPDHGITIVAVCPGIMLGENLVKFFRSADDVERVATQTRAGFELVTIGRCSLPEEVANVVAFLASEAGAYLHGTAVSVGGGMSD